jgi:hypothetical protein
MSEIELTEIEQSAYELAIEDLEKDRKQSLLEATDFGTDLMKQYGPGTYGSFEVGDRAHIISSNWQDYIADHPFILMHPELYRCARFATFLMLEVYQKAMTMDDDARREKEDKCPT